MVRFAIVGCGHIARKHVEAIRNTPGAALHMVCDTYRIGAETFAAHHNVPRWTSDYEAVLQDPDVDAVSICTPSGTHASLAVQAARAGKHVIVEKPIALTLADADAIVRTCRSAGVKLTVVHPNRFRPAVMELKKAVEQGLFGRLSHINATVRWNRDQAYYEQAAWRGTKSMDGGVLMNQAIHNLDLMLWLMGPVMEVQAYTTTRLRSIESEDVAVALVNFENGMVGVIEAASTIFPKNYEESISVFGEKGSAVISGPTGNWIKHWVFADTEQAEAQALIDRIDREPYGVPGHERIVADFVEAISLDRGPTVGGEDGRRALELVLAVYQAAERRSPIRFDPAAV